MSAERPITEQTMLTPAEVARRWRVNVKVIYTAIQKGELPAVRIGKKVLRIPIEMLRRLEQQGRVVSPGGQNGGSTR